MAVTKQFLKTKPVCKVKFKLTSEDVNGAESVYLTGDFNNWSETAYPMKRLKDGSFTAQVDLEAGKEYRFRYLLDSGQWANDPDADRYEYCQYAGEENSLICC